MRLGFFDSYERFLRGALRFRARLLVYRALLLRLISWTFFLIEWQLSRGRVVRYCVGGYDSLSRGIGEEGVLPALGATRITITSVRTSNRFFLHRMTLSTRLLGALSNIRLVVVRRVPTLQPDE